MFIDLYQTEKFKTRKNYYCKSCGKDVSKSTIATRCFHNRGHWLHGEKPEDEVWDSHSMPNFIGIYHNECVPDFKKQESPFEIIVEKIESKYDSQ
jgi:hypothetical protein